jgi:outer membrane lipopolysaccharide assembly protein LptE/RlpB
MMIKIKLPILLVLMIVLTACGFKAYNARSLSPRMQTMYVQSVMPYSTFTTSLKHFLKSAGVNLLDTPEPNELILNIDSISLTHDNPNIVSSAQATVYNFTYIVTFNVADTKGRLIPEQTVLVTRTLTLSPNEVLEASGEVMILKEEMERELILKLFNVLSAKGTRQALNSYKL